MRAAPAWGRNAQPFIDTEPPPRIPTDPKELALCLADPMWRLAHLYKILVKDEEEDDGTVIQFRPNRAQRRFIARLWHRNIILKARQLGFTTLICILWLDHTLFKPNQRCGIVAHDRDAAKAIFRDKVKFAYQNLPPAILAQLPTLEMNADEILFANNSSIRVATSMRSGTMHRLLVSEYGKICAKYPDKANEVKTGSLQAVPTNGIAVIESTAEGMDGNFFKMSEASRAMHELGRRLGVKDWRFHFYAWWQEPRYRVDPATVIISKENEDYFDDLETPGVKDSRPPIVLDAWQRAWYVATLVGDFADDEQMMWREYPSYPEEAFKVSTEGTYYKRELAQARKEGRIGFVPYMPGVPVNTFWDIGTNDLMTIWFHQHIGMAHNFIDYYENSGEAPSHYARILQERGYVYGWHYLPHDGAAKRVQEDSILTYEEMFRNLGMKNIDIVQRTHSITAGIDATREKFPGMRFDETKCKKGLAHIANYRKQWNERLGTWSDQPRHDEASNAADGLRQFGQGYIQRRAGQTKRRRSTGSWKTA